MTQNSFETARASAWQRIENLRAEWETVCTPVVPPTREPPPLPPDYNRFDYIHVCKYGDLSDLQALIAKGLDIHKDHDFALRLAAEKDHPEQVRLLLELGADVWTIPEHSFDAVIENGYLEVLRLLLDKDRNLLHEGDDYPLRLAAEKGLTAVVGILLDYGADMHAQEDMAFKLAACNEHHETVGLFIERGAPPEALTPEQLSLYEAFKATPKKKVQAEQILSETFQSAVWTGHVPEMIALWSQVPEPLKSEIDFSHILSAARHQSLRRQKAKITLVK
jgi:hypothetical protein